MMAYNKTDIKAMDKRFRTQFVNSLSGFKSLFLIGTKSASAQSNLAIFNSVIHIGADPPLLGFVSRPNSVARHTLENIMATGEYSLNSVDRGFYKNAHQTGGRYHVEVSEFDVAKLTEEYIKGFHPPFVAESSLKMAMSLKERIDIQSNGTHLIVGQIEEVFLKDDLIQPDGFIDIEKLQIIGGSGLDAYHSTSLIERLPYAKAKSL